MFGIPEKEKEQKEYEYQVALSFAGADRQYAEKLAELLRNRGISVFYDYYEQADLWGRDLYQHLQSVYRDKAQYCIVFLSKAYTERLWTQHELKQMQARAFRENKEYILPLRLDDTSIPGINETTGYIDLRSTSIESVAELVEKKLDILADFIGKNLSSSNTVERNESDQKAQITNIKTGYWNSTLREVLSLRFSKEELSDLCFDLISETDPSTYEKLSSSDKGEMIRRLILYVQRHNLFNKLVNDIRRRRPDIEV